MVHEAREGVGVEIIILREVVITIGNGAELVSKPDAVGNLRAELKPLEIEVATKAYFCEIVHEVHHDGILVVAADIEAHTASGNDVGTVVAFAFGRPLEVQRNTNRDSQHMNLIEIFFWRSSNRVSALSLILKCTAGELHSRAEAQVEVAAQAQVGNEPHVEARKQAAHACMVDFRFPCERVDLWYLAICHSETGEIEAQLETEVEELVIHVRAVHGNLGGAN